MVAKLYIYIYIYTCAHHTRVLWGRTCGFLHDFLDQLCIKIIANIFELSYSYDCSNVCIAVMFLFFRGLFYVLISGMNHSCQPNVEVLGTSNDAAHIQVRMLRAVSAGELLCPSYIDLNGIFFPWFLWSHIFLIRILRGNSVSSYNCFLFVVWFLCNVFTLMWFCSL